MSTEPLATALLLAVFGALLAVSALFSRASERFSVPVALVFLGIGMLAGSEGIGRIAFEDYGFAFRLGTVALVLILMTLDLLGESGKILADAGVTAQALNGAINEIRKGRTADSASAKAMEVWVSAPALMTMPSTSKPSS